jgi:hypothetical protein
MIMQTVKFMALSAAALLLAGCQGQNPPATYTGPVTGGSVTIFTLAMVPGSPAGCQLADASLTRPVRLTVLDDKADLLTDGGIHYSLDRDAPNLYSGGYRVKIAADLRSSPKKLTFGSNDDLCRWEATAP